MSAVLFVGLFAAAFSGFCVGVLSGAVAMMTFAWDDVRDE